MIIFLMILLYLFIYQSKEDEENEENEGILKQLFSINNLTDIISKSQRKQFYKKLSDY